MMKTTTPYPILRIGVENADNSRFLRATHGELRRGWSRDCDYPALFEPQTFYAQYRRDRGDDRLTFRLYLLRTDPNTVSVVSIVPGTGTLTASEHRAVLDDFRSSVLDRPETCHFPVVMVEPASTAPSTPPPEVVKVLERWTPSVNHGAGFHPFDRFHWQSLIVALHMTKRGIDFHWLVDWFHLNHLLPQAALNRLEEKFVSSLRLLNCHDEYLDLQRELKGKRDGSSAS